MSHIIRLLLYSYAVLHIAWPHLTDCITLHWLHYSALIALHCIALHRLYYITLYSTSTCPGQGSHHSPTRDRGALLCRVCVEWTGHTRHRPQRCYNVPAFLALLSLLSLPYSPCSLFASPSLLFSLCFHFHILCVVSSSSLVLMILSYLEILA